MENNEFLEDEIDWSSLLTELTDPSAAEFFSDPSPDCLVSLRIGEIESMLMNDNDYNVETNQQLLNNFFADIFVDHSSLSPSSASGTEVIELPTHKDENGSNESGNVIPAEEKPVDEPEVNNNNDSANNDSNNDDADDPISKKRRRQLRNRDAAVRSRERKKMYVKDLEIKSRYLEGECKKLGRLLQCVLAENQALRFSMQKGNAYDASSAKQESAVLLLESLLLGSLLWFLGIMCLFTLPKPFQSDLESVPQVQVEEKAPANLVQKEAGIKLFLLSVVKSRRCKASRTKMKMTCHVLSVLASTFGLSFQDTKKCERMVCVCYRTSD